MRVKPGNITWSATYQLNRHPVYRACTICHQAGPLTSCPGHPLPEGSVCCPLIPIQSPPIHGTKPLGAGGLPMALPSIFTELGFRELPGLGQGLLCTSSQAHQALGTRGQRRWYRGFRGPVEGPRGGQPTCTLMQSPEPGLGALRRHYMFFLPHRTHSPPPGSPHGRETQTP